MSSTHRRDEHAAAATGGLRGIIAGKSIDEFFQSIFIFKEGLPVGSRFV